MAIQRQSLKVLVLALAIFALTAILPVAVEVLGFVINLFRDPSSVSAVLLDSRQLILLSRSLSIAAGTALVALALGLPAAILLSARDLPCRRLFYSLILIPLLIPPYIMAGAWIHLLSPGGLVNRTVTSILGADARLSVFSIAGCIWCLGLSFFPLIAIVVAAGLSRVDRNLQDIARLSTGRWGVFRHSTFVQILPHLLASVCLVIVFSLGRYGVPSLLGVNTYPVEIFSQFSAFYDENAALAVAMPLFATVIALILLQQRIMRGRFYMTLTPASEATYSANLGKWRSLGVIFVSLMFIISTVLPFSSVLLHTQGFGTIVSSLRSASDSLLTTTVLALLASVISVAVALPVASYLAHSNSRFSRFLDVVCWLPIAIPGTITGLGYIRLAGLFPALRNSDSIGILLLIAYVGLFSAFAIRILEASYRRSDPNVADAAAIDCRNRLQRLIHIDVPLHSQAIAASMIVVFVLVVGELNATVLLIPPGRATLAVTIDNLLHYGANVNASVLCLTEAVFVILAVAGTTALWYTYRSKKQ